MFLKKLTLFQFKSYEERSFEFCERLNFILGNNGSGKTNILEAIYFLCITKSFSGLTDAQLIQHHTDFFVIHGDVDSDRISCSMKDGQRKILNINKQGYEKLSEHIGRFPIVFVSPNDHDYIRDASDSRRKLLDELFCQVNNTYLLHLQEYNKLNKQRNQLLKQFKEKNYFDLDLIQVFDEQICTHHLYVSNFRRENLEKLTQNTQKYYEILSDNKEKVNINYLAQDTFSKENFLSLSKNNLEKDKATLRSNTGCHRDDYEFLIEDLALKKYGSQGQQKSFMLALQLAKYDFLKSHCEKLPFLLLDDVFDKLDINRIQKLLKIVEKPDFGQVFITDASEERTKGFIQDLDCAYLCLKIED